jgi:hypothetical protein
MFFVKVAKDDDPKIAKISISKLNLKVQIIHIKPIFFNFKIPTENHAWKLIYSSLKCHHFVAAFLKKRLAWTFKSSCNGNVLPHLITLNLT